MISLFRVYNEAIFLLLLALTILLNINLLFSPINLNLQGYASITGGIANGLQNFLNIPKWLYFIIFILSQFGGAVYFSLVMTKHKIVNNHNYIPALLFVTIFALINTYTFNCVAFLLLPLFILLLDRVFHIAVNDKNLANAFDLGLVCGILFFSYSPYILLVVFAYLMFIILKPFYWRYWVASAIGFVCPLLITLIVYTIFNQTAIFFEYFTSSRSFLYSESTISTTNLILHLSVLIISIGILSLSSISEQYKTIPFVRNYLFLIIMLALILLFFQMIRSLWVMELLIVVFIVMAIILTNFIIRCRSALLKNILHTLILVYLVYFQYFSGN